MAHFCSVAELEDLKKLLKVLRKNPYLLYLKLTSVVLPPPRHAKLSYVMSLVELLLHCLRNAKVLTLDWNSEDVGVLIVR